MADGKKCKRTFCEEYIQYGFTSFFDKGVVKGQCVLCQKVLGNDSLRPSKLKYHLDKTHPEHSAKDVNFFKRHECSLKRMKLDSSGAFQMQSRNVLKASYEVSLEIAKQKKPHTIGETLIKPCALKMVNLVLGGDSEKKIQQIPLSDNTVSRRIEEMSIDIKEQVISEIKDAGLFALQLDESTDVSSCSQLLVFTRYVHDGKFKEEFLFCYPLETTTKGEDIMKKVTDYFSELGLSWENVCAVCTDGAPAMLGSKSGFVSRVKAIAPGVTVTHCMIHRQALASRTLPRELQAILDSAIKIVNYVKSMPVNTRLFRELCKDLDSEHQLLLFYTKVRWLSKGNVLNRVFELREELKMFLDMQDKETIFFNDPLWEPRLAYLTDIFDQLNKLNLKLQGKDTTVIHFVDTLRTFVAKIKNWNRKVSSGNFAMFEKFSEVAEGKEEEIESCLQNEIISHLQNLCQEFSRYFPDLEVIDLSLVRNPFNVEPDIIPDSDQDEFLEMKFDSGMKEFFKEHSIQEFWSQASISYPRVGKLGLKTLLPFASTYLCESGFSTLLQIKTKTRNRLGVEHDMRCALSTTVPQIDTLVVKKQAHPSH